MRSRVRVDWPFGPFNTTKTWKQLFDSSTQVQLPCVAEPIYTSHSIDYMIHYINYSNIIMNSKTYFEFEKGILHNPIQTHTDSVQHNSLLELYENSNLCLQRNQ